MKYRRIIISFVVCCLCVAQMVRAESDSELMQDARALASSGKYEKAVKVYSRILKGNHRHVDALVGRGNARLRIDGETEEAKEDFAKVVVLSPDYMDAHVGLATALRRSGDDAGAEKVLSEANKICGDNASKRQYLVETAWAYGHWDFARKIDPKYKDIPSEREIQQAERRKILDEAAKLRQASDIDDAEKIYRDLLKKNPQDIDALVGMGFCHLRDSQHLKKAVEYFEEALKLSPEYVDVYLGLATVVKRTGTQQEVQALLTKAEVICGDNKEKRQYLADTAWALGHWDFARKIDPKYKDVLSESDIARAEQKKTLEKAMELRLKGFLADAEKIYRNLLEANPEDVDALVGMGYTKIRDSKHVDEAVDYFSKAIELSSEYIDAYIGLATAQKRTGDDEGAAKTLDKANEISGEDKKEYLAETAWNAGHWEFARKIMPKYRDVKNEREINEANYIKVLDHARQLRLDGYVEEAEEIYLDLLEKNPDDVDAMVGLGYCRLRSRDRVTEALNDFLTAIDLSPLYTDAYIGGAICYKRLHQQEALERILDDARIACEGEPKKMRYLATAAWRQGYYPLARSIDDEYPPEEDRVLLKETKTVKLTYGHSWLERGDDWDEIRLSGSWRVRPDISLSAEYDNWWRYGGEYDFNIGIGASYRHNRMWSVDYDYEFSDTPGYLADQKHSAGLRYRLYKRLNVSVGQRFSIYDDVWSRRTKLGADVYWKDFLAYASYSFGTDTSRQDVESWSVGLGYYNELRYSISAGYSQGEDTVDIERDDEIIFETDDLESIYVRGTYYFSDTLDITLRGMEEYRNSDLFRRELTISLSKSF